MRPGGAILQKTLTISGTQTVLYDMRAAYIAAGFPSSTRVKVTLIVNAVCQRGITQGSGWPAGSSCKIVNNSTVAGIAGAGGAGAFTSSGGAVPGAAGAAGGDAIYLTLPTVIDNGSGYIFGGGGGGGGGGAESASSPPGSDKQAAGGGGGGGEGYNNAAGGAAGYTWLSPTGDGTAGAAGDYATGAFGGRGGFIDPTQCAGGTGGVWGQAGAAGGAPTGGSGYDYAQGSGGAAGYAVRANGKSISFLAGYNGTQVAGAVA